MARLADRISAVFVPVVLVLAVLTLVGWLAATRDVEAAFTAAVAVLIIACPCALGLATPTAILVGTGRGAQLGVLIRGPEILESTRRVDTVVLDKTGTVTEGRMRVVDVWGAGYRPPTGRPSTGTGCRERRLRTLTDAPDVLRFAAAVESLSEHPIARAITAADEPPASRTPRPRSRSRASSPTRVAGWRVSSGARTPDWPWAGR